MLEQKNQEHETKYACKNIYKNTVYNTVVLHNHMETKAFNFD